MRGTPLIQDGFTAKLYLRAEISSTELMHVFRNAVKCVLGNDNALQLTLEC